MQTILLIFFLLAVATNAINVSLTPILSDINLPSTIRTGKFPGQHHETIFVSQLNGKIYAIPNSGTPYVFIDLSNRVLQLDENGGDYGFLAQNYERLKDDGLVYFYYSLNQTKGISIDPVPDPCNITSLNQIWNTSLYHHTNVLEEWFYNGTTLNFNRRLLNIKWPTQFNHGFNSIQFVDDLDTMLIALGAGGNYDVLNLAQNDNFPHGKILSIDVFNTGWYMNDPFASFNEISNNYLHVVAKGLRNIVSLYTEKYKGNTIKYIAQTGISTYESMYGFEEYNINFGFRNFEGLFPSSLVNECGSRSIIYYQNAINTLSNKYNPFCGYNHNDQDFNKISSTTLSGALPYNGNIIELKNKLVFTEFLNTNTGKGALAFANINRNNLQELQDYEIVNVTNVLIPFQSFFSVLGTNSANKELYLGITNNFGPTGSTIYVVS